MNTETKRKFLIDFLYILAIAAIVFFLLRHVIPLFTPFIMGFLIALLLRPLVDRLSRLLKLKQSLAATIILIVFYTVIGIIVSVVVIRLSVSLTQIFANLPKMFQNDIQPFIAAMMASVTDFLSDIDPDVLASLEAIQTSILSALSSIVSTLSTNALSILTNLITGIPAFLVTFLFAVISSFFFTLDLQTITRFIRNQIGEKALEIIDAVQESFSSTILKFLRAYFILMSMTFVELTISFTLLGFSNPMGVAVLIAMIDILPVFGTGTVMIPWGIIELFNGNLEFGVSLLVVYLIITVIRNIVEPKIVGDQIGLYPLVTLMSMYIGTQLFGIIGLFGLPITITILNNLQEKEIIHLYNKIEPKKKKRTKKDA